MQACKLYFVTVHDLSDLHQLTSVLPISGVKAVHKLHMDTDLLIVQPELDGEQHDCLDLAQLIPVNELFVSHSQTCCTPAALTSR